MTDETTITGAPSVLASIKDALRRGRQVAVFNPYDLPAETRAFVWVPISRGRPISTCTSDPSVPIARNEITAPIRFDHRGHFVDLSELSEADKRRTLGCICDPPPSPPYMGHADCPEHGLY